MTTSPTRLDFVDASHGWAVGDAGTVLATLNGGATWAAQRSGLVAGVALKGLSFVDTLHGWAVGGSGGSAAVIIGTTDGGHTWNQQALPGGLLSMSSVIAVDPSHAWAVGVMRSSQGTIGAAGAVVATSDAGRSWTQQAIPAGIESLAAVTFVDLQHGWAAGAAQRTAPQDQPPGAILATVDGGATWHRQRVGAGTFALTDVSFLDRSHGWAAVSTPPGQPPTDTLTTGDGGSRWVAGPYKPAQDDQGFLKLRFADASHGWAIEAGCSPPDAGKGCAPFPMRSADGGASWTNVPVPLGQGMVFSVSDVASINASTAWVVGRAAIDRGVRMPYQVTGPNRIWMTRDGGSTWTEQRVP